MSKAVLFTKSAVIRKEGDEYVLYTKDGSRVLGRHLSRQKAIKQEYAIQKSQEKRAAKKNDKKKDDKRNSRWWLPPALTGAAGYGIFRGADWLVPHEAAQRLTPFAKAMLDDAPTVVGKDMSVDDATSYGDSYIVHGSRAMGARLMGGRFRPDELLSRARKRSVDVQDWLEQRPRAARSVPGQARELLDSLARYEWQGEESDRHYREFTSGPAGAYRFSLGEYNPWDGGEFEAYLRHFAGKNNVPRQITPADRDLVISKFDDFVTNQHRGRDDYPTVWASTLPEARQAQLISEFRGWLQANAPELAQKERSLSSAIGAHRSLDVGPSYGGGANIGRIIRHGGMALGGATMLGAAAWALHRRRMRQKEEELGAQQKLIDRILAAVRPDAVPAVV